MRVERFLDHFYPLILITNSKMFLNVKVLHRLGWVGISRGAGPVASRIFLNPFQKAILEWDLFMGRDSGV